MSLAFDQMTLALVVLGAVARLACHAAGVEWPTVIGFCIAAAYSVVWALVWLSERRR